MDKAHFNQDYWKAYKKVNSKFAACVLEEAGARDLIWVHDYHLSLAPQLIRDELDDARIAFFWHIPWAPQRIFSTIPWSREILEGLMGSDLIGFQTRSYAKNFMESVEKNLDASVERASGAVRRHGCKTLVRVFPIGIDHDEFASQAQKADTERAKERMRRRLRAEQIVLGVDRLDYTKGILERIWAFERFLEKYPAFRGRVVLVQVSAPSRTRVMEYRELKRKVDENVARINGKFQRIDWVPIRYFYRHISQKDLITYYRAADVALVTPLADGINLVAKEYVAAKEGEDGVLILSKFAGAAEEMKEALLVNPYNTEEVMEAARRALEMPLDEKRRRLKALQEKVRGHDVHWWVKRFLEEWDRSTSATASSPPGSEGSGLG